MTSPSTQDLPGLTFPALGSQANTVRVLSLTQPWATLVAIGAKRIETRSWQTRYRGPIAIHAAKGFPGSAKALCFQKDFARALAPLCRELEPTPPLFLKWPASLPTGAIIATCELLDVVPTPEMHIGGPPPRGPGYPEMPERAFGDYSPNRFAWHLGNIVALAKPVPAKGSLGLWTFQWPEKARMSAAKRADDAWVLTHLRI